MCTAVAIGWLAVGWLAVGAAGLPLRVCDELCRHWEGDPTRVLPIQREPVCRLNDTCFYTALPHRCPRPWVGCLRAGEPEYDKRAR